MRWLVLLALLIPGIALAHGKADWVMQDPNTRYCCGPRDCGPVHDYGGWVDEVSTGVWVVTIPPGGHPLAPNGLQQTFKEGESNVFPSQRFEEFVCVRNGRAMCFFYAPGAF